MTTEYFTITSVHRDDIRQAMREHDELTPSMEQIINDLSAEDMQLLADKMANDYLEQLFWSSLYILFVDRILPTIQTRELVTSLRNETK